MADNQSRVSININVEVSEALTGLKAIQREAKKATQALRELEEAQQNYNITINIDNIVPREEADVHDIAEKIAKAIRGNDVPNHVKKYAQTDSITSKSNTSAWFKGGIADE